MAAWLPQTIAKEAILSVQFSAQEVLPPADQEKRKRDLLKAMVLGNTYKQKVILTFHTEEGIKKARTTVWGITQHWVLLKDGIQLPLRQIEKVDFR